MQLELRTLGDPGSGPTVRQITAKYLKLRAAEHAAGRIGESLLNRLHRRLGEFCQVHGDRAAATIKPADLTTFILGRTNWKSDHTRQHAARAVLSLFIWAEAEDLIARNGLRRFKACWNTLQPRGAILPGEFRAILDAARLCDGRHGRACPSRHAFRVAFWFLAETACRTCEMREMLWDEVDWQAGLIRLDRHKTRRSSGRARLIPLTTWALRLLRLLYRHRQEGQTHVFVTSRGGPWTCRNFDAIAERFRVAAGVDDSRTPYTLRHGWTVAGLQAGAGQRQLADVLGQVSTRLIEWYGRDAQQNAEYLRATTEAVRDSRANGHLANGSRTNGSRANGHRANGDKANDEKTAPPG
jgi:integrase